MSQKQFNQANLAAAAGGDGAVARSVSPTQANQTNLAVTLPQDIINAIQAGLNQQSQIIGQTLGIIPTPAPPFTPNQKLTTGLNQPLTGLNLPLLNILSPTLLTLLRTLLGDPDLSLLPINVSITWTVSGGAPKVPLQKQVQVVGPTTATTFDMAFRPQIKEKTQSNPDTLPFNVGGVVVLSVQIAGQTITAPPINLSLPVSIPTLPFSAISDALKAALAKVATGFQKGLSIVLPPSPNSLLRRPATAVGISPALGNNPALVAPDKKLTAKLSKSTSDLTLNPANFLNELLLEGLQSLLDTSPINPLSVNVAIQWSVSGGQLSGRLLPGQNQARVQGASNAPAFDLVFLPQLIERTKNNPNSVEFNIEVSLTLSVKVLDQIIDIPPIKLKIPILLPTLPIPVLLGLFRHAGFAIKDGNKQGFLMLIVPSDSLFNIAANATEQSVKDELADLLEVATTLDRILGLFSTIAQAILPSGLDKLVEAIRAIGGFALNGITVTTDTAIPNLNKVKMINNPFFFKFNDIEAENEITSLILVGGAGVQAKLFRERNFDSGGGRLEVRTSAALVSSIRNLSHRVPTASPDPTRAVVPNPGEVDRELWSDRHFSDSISSLQVTFP
jgi:hypothetical protein